MQPLKDATHQQAQGTKAAPSPIGVDHGEPRTGYRPELDEQTKRFGQYGMVQDANARSTGATSEQVPAATSQDKLANEVASGEDAFENEFKSRQTNTVEGKPDI